MAKYLDESGLRTLWSKIKAKFTGIQSSVDSATSLAGSANRNANDAVSEVSTMKNRVNMISQSVDALAVSKVDATGTVAKSNGVTDYGDRNRTIEIGYAGTGLSTTQYFAAYDATGKKIKDINITDAKNVLGINNLQSKLVSGSSIKTINGHSLLGSGNINTIGSGNGSGTSLYLHVITDDALTASLGTNQFWYVSTRSRDITYLGYDGGVILSLGIIKWDYDGTPLHCVLPFYIDVPIEYDSDAIIYIGKPNGGSISYVPYTIDTAKTYNEAISPL